MWVILTMGLDFVSQSHISKAGRSEVELVAAMLVVLRVDSRCFAMG